MASKMMKEVIISNLLVPFLLPFFSILYGIFTFIYPYLSTHGDRNKDIRTMVSTNSGYYNTHAYSTIAIVSS